MTQAQASQPAQHQAILTKLVIRQWGASKTDQSVTSEIHAMKAADAFAGRYVKNLIDPKAMRVIRHHATGARLAHYNLTRAWEDGRRLLPTALMGEYTLKLEDHARQHDQAVVEFVEVYPEMINQAKLSLGDMFLETEYPSVEELRDMFSIQWNFEPVPHGAALPMSIQDREQLSEAIEKEARAKLAESQEALFYRVKNALEGFSNKLASYGSKLEAGEHTKFHSSILNELEDLADLLPKLNIENDPFMDGIAQKLKEKLLALDVEALKENPHARTKAMVEANSILESFG